MATPSSEIAKWNKRHFNYSMKGLDVAKNPQIVSTPKKPHFRFYGFTAGGKMNYSHGGKRASLNDNRPTKYSIS